MRLYPNPTKDIVYLDYDGNIDSLSIFDAKGNAILRIRPKEDSLDISMLAKGIYFLEIKDGDSVKRQQLYAIEQYLSYINGLIQMITSLQILADAKASPAFCASF